MVRFGAGPPNGVAVQQLEVLVRAAIFKPANALAGLLLQQAAAQVDAAYQPKPGPVRKGRAPVEGQGVFGRFPWPRDYYYHEGKQADGTAKTRQIYPGCVFTRHRTDEEGHPVRDWESTPSVSSFKPIAEFGPCLRQEAIRRGRGRAGKVVVLIDGARGLENMGKDCFKDGLPIVDFYHAMEHAGPVLAALIGKKQPDCKKRLRRWAKQWLKDNVQSLIQQARQECAGQPRAAAVEAALGYFVRNAIRMQYGTFRAAGYFIGSGVVEAGCKRVIGVRCKQAGLFWSESGAENILALRCIHSSRRLEDFWKHRLNEQAARNDTLPLAA
jgi:hypothetical protein